MPKVNDRNQPRTRPRRTLKWVSKWQSRSSPVATRVGRINIYTSVTLSLTKLAFMYASNIVRWVWKCPRHSGTMLSAVAVLAAGHFEYDRDRGPSCVWFPLYRLSPTAPLFSMADGQSYERGTDCSFTKMKSLADVENVSVIQR